MSFEGPSPELIGMFAKANAAPPVDDVDEQIARSDRVLAASEFSDLSEADQAWMRSQITVVENGGSYAFTDPSTWGGDWSATDDAAVAGVAPETKAGELGDDDGWVGL